MLIALLLPAGVFAAEFDPNGVYYAYLGLQSQNQIFRNAWACPYFGAEGTDWAKYDDNHFNDMFHTDNGLQAGVFQDIEIRGNGTYSVSVSGFDFGNDEMFNLIFFSTNIPLAGNPVTFSDVTVKMDGSTKSRFDGDDGNRPIIPGLDTNETKDFYEVHCISGLLEYDMPTDEISIEFTVSGFAYDLELLVY